MSTPTAAGIIAFSADGSFVLICEGHNRGISFPKGGQTPADSSLEHTAAREVLEETGITSDRIDLLRRGRSGHYHQYVEERHPFVRYFIGTVQGPVRRDIDYQRAAWDAGDSDTLQAAWVELTAARQLLGRVGRASLFDNAVAAMAKPGATFSSLEVILDCLEASHFPIPQISSHSRVHTMPTLASTAIVSSSVPPPLPLVVVAPAPAIAPSSSRRIAPASAHPFPPVPLGVVAPEPPKPSSSRRVAPATAPLVPIPVQAARLTPGAYVNTAPAAPRPSTRQEYDAGDGDDYDDDDDDDEEGYDSTAAASAPQPMVVNVFINGEGAATTATSSSSAAPAPTVAVKRQRGERRGRWVNAKAQAKARGDKVNVLFNGPAHAVDPCSISK